MNIEDYYITKNDAAPLLKEQKFSCSAAASKYLIIRIQEIYG